MPTITVLDVGHGNSTIVEDTNGVLVIDAGRGSALLEFLTGRGIQRVGIVLISHADQDHLDGLTALLSCGLFEIGKIRINPDALKESAVWDNVLYELDGLQRTGRVDFEPLLVEDFTNQFGQGELTVEVLGPSRYLAGKASGGDDGNGRRIGSNSLSAVVRLVLGGDPLLLIPGDLDDIGLDEILRAGRDMRAAVLVFPHHGGRPGHSPAAAFASRLQDAVQASTILFSIGRGRPSTPRPEIVGLLTALQRPPRIACTQLSEQCAASLPADPQEAHLAKVFAAGRAKRRCCAGSIVIDTANPWTLSPGSEAHEAFIAQHASSALCKASATRGQPGGAGVGP